MDDDPIDCSLATPPPDDDDLRRAELDPALEAGLDLLQEALLTLDEGGVVCTLNARARQVTGWGEGALGMPAHEVLRFTADDDRDRHLHLSDLPCFEDFTPATLVRSNGSHVAIRICARAVGRSTAVVFVEESRATGIDLGRADGEHLANAIIETVRTPLVVVSATGRVHESNAAFQDALELEAADVADENFFELADGEFDNPRVRELFSDLVARDLRVHDVVVTQNSERFGRRVYLFSASSVTLPQDEERFLLLSIEDVTAAHDALKRRTEEVEQFAYSVSHDMKSPLVSVLGFVGLAREELDRANPAEARALLSRIETSAQRMSTLIDDLLRLVQIGRADPRDEPLELAALIQDLIDTPLAGPIAACGAKIVLEPGLPRVLASRAYMNQTFSNLLGNALQYGCPAPGATIRVGGRPAPGGHRVFVRDEGPGVPEEYRERIFGLFQRLVPSRNNTGIGLAIVAKIMDFYKGRAWVESSEGNGATFWIFLPSERVLGHSEPE